MSEKQRILVFRIGNLGDTLVAVPALRAIREQFPEAHLTLLCNRSTKGEVVASEVLKGSQLFDDYMDYPSSALTGGFVRKTLGCLLLLVRLRVRRFDTIIYMPPTWRPENHVSRDRRLFRWAGMKILMGFEYNPPVPRVRLEGQPLPQLASEGKNLLNRLQASGISVPELENARTDLGISKIERNKVVQWIKRQQSDDGRHWIAVGPGSKMPAKVWPSERYQSVVESLIRQYDIWPVVFGGPQERELGGRLLQRWKRGYNAAGELDFREAAAAMERCQLYVGNDTGTMHLAASAGVRCVATFSSVYWPGEWYPIGQGHVVLRKWIDCEGCMSLQCTERNQECLRRITVDEVTNACCAVLNEQLMLLPGQSDLSVA